jgi:hypothetical protein
MMAKPICRMLSSPEKCGCIAVLSFTSFLFLLFPLHFVPWLGFQNSSSHKSLWWQSGHFDDLLLTLAFPFQGVLRVLFDEMGSCWVPLFR